MAVAAFLLTYWSRGEWFGSDDLGYGVRLATEPLGHALLHPPPDKYLIAFPLLVYKALFETFGMDSYRPYRLTASCSCSSPPAFCSSSFGGGFPTASPSRRRS
jgi:hypothetical protein